jgi:hypothetical protein
MQMDEARLAHGPRPYMLVKRFVHLGIKTIELVMSSAPPLLNNSTSARVSAAGFAKRRSCLAKRSGGAAADLICGASASGSSTIGHVPISLAVYLHVRRRAEPAQNLTMDDVERSEPEALSTWQAIERRALKSRQPTAS